MLMEEFEVLFNLFNSKDIGCRTNANFVYAAAFLYTVHFLRVSFFSRRFSARMVTTWRMAAMGWM